MLSEVSRHRMFLKHPMSFCRASTVYPRRISPNKSFPRHRMSGRHPMSNRDEPRWGEQTQKWCFRGSIDVGATGRSPLQVFFRHRMFLKHPVSLRVNVRFELLAFYVNLNCISCTAAIVFFPKIYLPLKRLNVWV